MAGLFYNFLFDVEPSLQMIQMLILFDMTEGYSCSCWSCVIVRFQFDLASFVLGFVLKHNN